MENEWKTLGSREVHANPYFSVSEDEIVHDNGYRHTYYTLHAKSAVYALPFDGERLLMVNQYRHPVGRRMWSFPAGTCESGDFLQNARKELKEETGYTAGRWTRLGHFASNAVLSDAKLEVYLAEDLQPGEPAREQGEVDMVMQFRTPAEVEAMVDGGELITSTSLAAYFLFKRYLERRK